MKTLRIALAQINPTVGDIKGNSEKIIEYIEKAGANDADIVVFPELAVTGYPPEDLLLDKSFLKDAMSHIDNIIAHTTDIVAIVGFADSTDKKLYNAAGIITNRTLIGTYRKINFTKSNVFDDSKYFKHGRNYPLYDLNGIGFYPVFFNDLKHLDNTGNLQFNTSPSIILCMDASCYHTGKPAETEKAVSKIASRNGKYIAYLNITGGQDEWVFEGGGFIVDTTGKIIAKSPVFEENLLLTDIKVKNNAPSHDYKIKSISIPSKLKEKELPVQSKIVNTPEPVEEVYRALVLGTKDYVRKNGFHKVVLGLSGGIDSALVAVIAVDALGKENVAGVSMPTRFTSEESKADAREIAKHLNIQFIEVPIDTLYDYYLNMCTSIFNNKPPSQLTQENIQPRIRANILMALSNNFGWLVLTTGNKSEVGSGYSTLYGDTAGGFALIKDVSKTRVYELARWINKKAGRHLIPERILTKAPSAELKHNQKDTDTLPPYEVLDPIMKAYIKDNKTIEEITVMGYSPELITKIINIIQINEYKRRQSPIGIKITKKSFGKDRNFPITNRYRF
jgi:NAD+ synthase (glutamine-hydrolysing)